MNGQICIDDDALAGLAGLAEAARWYEDRERGVERRSRTQRLCELSDRQTPDSHAILVEHDDRSGNVEEFGEQRRLVLVEEESHAGRRRGSSRSFTARAA